MAKPVRTDHPFADLIGMHIDHAEGGGCQSHLEAADHLHNPH